MCQVCAPGTFSTQGVACSSCAAGSYGLGVSYLITLAPTQNVITGPIPADGASHCVLWYVARVDCAFLVRVQSGCSLNRVFFFLSFYSQPRRPIYGRGCQLSLLSVYARHDSAPERCDCVQRVRCRSICARVWSEVRSSGVSLRALSDDARYCLFFLFSHSLSPPPLSSSFERINTAPHHRTLTSSRH